MLSLIDSVTYSPVAASEDSFETQEKAPCFDQEFGE